MSRGPSKQPAEEFELAALDHHADQTPLLPPHQGFAGQQQPRPTRGMEAAYSEEALTAPSYHRQYTDAASTQSGHTGHGQPMHPADPYAGGYNQAPSYGYNRPYSMSREPTDQSQVGGRPQYDEYGQPAYSQQSFNDSQQSFHNNNTNSRRSGGW